VADLGLRVVHVFDADGRYLPDWGDIGRVTAGKLMFRLGRDELDNIYISMGHGEVRRFSSDGVLDTEWGLDFGQGRGVVPTTLRDFELFTVDAGGRVYAAAAEGREHVVRFGVSGQVEAMWELESDCRARDIAVDASMGALVVCQDSVVRLDDQLTGVTPDASSPGSATVIWEGTQSIDGSQAIDIDSDGTLWMLRAAPVLPEHTSAADAWWMVHLRSDGSVVDEWPVPLGSQPLSRGVGMTRDAAGNVYVPATHSGGVDVFGPDGDHQRRIMHATPDTMLRMDAIAAYPDGTLLVLDLVSNELVHLDQSGAVLERIALPAEAAGRPGTNAALTGDLVPQVLLTAEGTFVVPSTRFSSILWLNAAGEVIQSEAIDEAGHQRPSGMALQPDGTVCRIDPDNARVRCIVAVDPPYPSTRRYDLPDETFLGVGIAVDGDAVYVSVRTRESTESGTTTTSGILKYHANGRLLGTFATFQPSGDALETPMRMQVDAAGRVYVVTLVQSRAPQNHPTMSIVANTMLRVFDTDGSLLVTAHLGEPYYRWPDVTLSEDGRWVYVSDPTSRQVLVYERD
jgi:DNA-binding beta-propeller fold protein YncE